MSAPDVGSPLGLGSINKTAEMVEANLSGSPVSPWAPQETAFSQAIIEQRPHRLSEDQNQLDVNEVSEADMQSGENHDQSGEAQDASWTSSSSNTSTSARLFVGGLDANISRSDLETEFGRFGKLREVWMAQRPPGFAFIEFEDIDSEAADNIVHAMNGTILKGALLRVERARDKNARRGAQMRAAMNGAMRQLSAVAAVTAGALPAATTLHPGFTTLAQQIAAAAATGPALIRGMPPLLGNAAPGCYLPYGPRPILHGGWGDAAFQALNGIPCVPNPAAAGMTFFQPILPTPTFYGIFPDYTAPIIPLGPQQNPTSLLATSGMIPTTTSSGSSTLSDYGEQGNSSISMHTDYGTQPAE